MFNEEQQAWHTEWRLKDFISELGIHKPTFVFLNACHSIDVVGRLERSVAVWSISNTFINLQPAGCRFDPGRLHFR